MRRRGLHLHHASLALIAALLFAGRAIGQAEIGVVVGAEGVLEVQRAGSQDWEPALLGAQVFAADRIRTGSTGGAKLLFRDDSVLDLAPATEILTERVGSDPAGERFLALVHVTAGKIRAAVGDQYAAPHSRYEVETPTAVAICHGGQLVVGYDAQNELTDVLVLEREVEVKATLGVIGPGVTVGAQESSQVRRGRFPSAAEALPAEALERQLHGLEILGTGVDRGVSEGHPALNARVLRPEDLPEAIRPTGAADGQAQVGSDPAGFTTETLAERISPDFRVHTQPIPEFRAASPGEPPSGGVQVDF